MKVLTLYLFYDVPNVILYQLFANLWLDEVTFPKKREEFFCPDVLKRQSVQALFKKNLKNYPKMLTVYFFNQINF